MIPTANKKAASKTHPLTVPTLALDTLSSVVAAPVDQVRTLYRTLLVFAAVSILILVIGLVEFVYFEPPGQHSGLKATIVGVFEYDPDPNKLIGPDKNAFPRTVQFAAEVDWSSLPKNMVFDARWYDGFGNVVGSVGPGTPQELASHTIVPVRVPPGFHHNLPGHYVFVVERYEGDVPVEVIARRVVLVER
jgi:hypothetical protein